MSKIRNLFLTAGLIICPSTRAQQPAPKIIQIMQQANPQIPLEKGKGENCTINTQGECVFSVDKAEKPPAPLPEAPLPLPQKDSGTSTNTDKKTSEKSEKKGKQLICLSEAGTIYAAAKDPDGHAQYYSPDSFVSAICSIDTSNGVWIFQGSGRLTSPENSANPIARDFALGLTLASYTSQAKTLSNGTTQQFGVEAGYLSTQETAGGRGTVASTFRPFEWTSAIATLESQLVTSASLLNPRFVAGNTAFYTLGTNKTEDAIKISLMETTGYEPGQHGGTYQANIMISGHEGNFGTIQFSRRPGDQSGETRAGGSIGRSHIILKDIKLQTAAELFVINNRINNPSGLQLSGTWGQMASGDATKWLSAYGMYTIAGNTHSGLGVASEIGMRAKLNSHIDAGISGGYRTKFLLIGSSAGAGVQLHLNLH